MSRHRRAPVRPRYGRISAVVVALAITSVAVLGGLGLFPRAVVSAPASADPQVHMKVPSQPVKRVAAPLVLEPPVTVAPDDSGEGRRVVFSQELQRVWLIEEGDEVQRTYPVSGSVSDNLQKGSYSVFSRSEQATGIDDSGTMKWFVRFAHGPRAAIGFHDIPVDDGRAVQTESQLGTPRSHGCIRQAADDAWALWRFAPVGTRVVVI